MISSNALTTVQCTDPPSLIMHSRYSTPQIFETLMVFSPFILGDGYYGVHWRCSLHWKCLEISGCNWGVFTALERDSLHWRGMMEHVTGCSGSRATFTPGMDNREFKQTDAAAVNRQISLQIQSDGCQGPTEFTWP